MRYWDRLTRRFKHGTVDGEYALSRAYRNLFSGNADQSERELVLADLAAKCGWNQVTAPETSEQRIWFNEGKRAAFALIFSHLSLSGDDLHAFENAIRHEAAQLNS